MVAGDNMKFVMIQAACTLAAIAQVLANPNHPVPWIVLVGVVALTAFTAWAVERNKA